MIDQLTEAFGICKNENCECNINLFYESTSESEIFIYDADTLGKELPSSIVNSDSNYQIKLVNEEEKEIIFIKIDQCLIIDNKIRRCDCAIINQNNFIFIEIKDVKTKQRKIARKEAIAQLTSTIELFLDKIDFTNLQLFAVIGFKTLRPYVVQPSKNTQRAIFKSKYNIELQEGSQIILS